MRKQQENQMAARGCVIITLTTIPYHPFPHPCLYARTKFFSDSTAFLFACKEDDNSINLSLLFYGNCASNYPSGFCMVVLVRVHITKQLEPTFLCYLGALVP